MTEPPANLSELRLLTRQQHLLGLLDLFGGHVRNLDFQKLLFLYCQEASALKLYDFVPYRFGAFSFTSYADRRKLIASRLLVDGGDHWHLTNDGKHVAAKSQDPSMIDFARRYKGLRGDDLVAESYRQFPYYATRSEIAARLLRNDKATLKRIEDSRGGQTAVPLATIGYEGRTIERYLKILLAAGVTLLCDVRRNAISRKYGFSKTTLANACDGVGIKYVHLSQLGVPSEYRRNLTTQADYDQLFSAYQREILPEQQEALSKIRAWIQCGENVALTCFEHTPQCCHRMCVANAIENGADERFQVRHL